MCIFLVPLFFHTVFGISDPIIWMSACLEACTSLMFLVSIFSGNSLCPRNDCSTFLDFGGGISVRGYSFHRSDCTSYHEMISPKRTLVLLKWQLSLLSFRFSFLHSCRTLHTALSWSALSSS